MRSTSSSSNRNKKPNSLSTKLLKCTIMFDHKETLPRDNVLKSHGDETRSECACKVT